MVCCRNARYFDLPLTSNETNKVDLRSDDDYMPQCGQHIEFDEFADLRRAEGHQQSDITTYANSGEWPHMCTIFKTQSSKINGKSGCSRTLEYVCGASLISKNAVLTSWHNIR